MRILIGTLYTIENDFENCCRAIQEQTHQDFEHFVIRNKPNKKAHDELYQTFMKRSDEFDLFLKIDADMVLRHNSILKEIIGIFQSYSELDHAAFTVRDWYSQLQIIGLHAFSKRAQWTNLHDRLFVDPAPEIPGRYVLFRSAPSPVADHSPNPSPEEAYLFGWHRGLKTVQRDASIRQKNFAMQVYHYNLLCNVWKQFRISGDLRRGLALYGAGTLFCLKGVSTLDEKKLNSQDEIDRLANTNFVELRKHLRPMWGITSIDHWKRMLKYGMTLRGYVFCLRLVLGFLKRLRLFSGDI